MGLVIKPVAQLLNVMNQGLYRPPNDEIRGIDLGIWPSPLQPVKPMGPPGSEPKAFQFFEGQNLLYTPRPDSFYTAAQLKQLATFPLASICISNVKDTLSRAPWEIQVKLKPGETRKEAARRAKGDENILKLSRFFEKPDRLSSWDEWIKPLLDDMLVIDAACVLTRKNFNGEIAELCVLRGESIVRYIDNNGWTPLPPYPAYAQNWWGIPLVNLTTDQLLYAPRNIVPRNTISSQLYGMSPTEQLAPEIEVGIKRLEFTLAYYTEGSVPGLLQVVPKGTSSEKISEAMGWMNSELAGNLAARRQIRLIQGWQEPGKQDQIIMTKEPLLADLYDEQMTRRIAFGYGCSPQRLTKQMNRASAEQAEEAADLEGTMPYFQWLKRSIMDKLIQQKFGLTDYEWVPDPFREPSFDKAAEAVNKVMSKPVMTINEVRDRLGLEPRSEVEADQLGMATANGWLPLDIAIEVARLQAGGGTIGGKQPNADAKPTDGDKKDAGDKKPNGKSSDAVARLARHLQAVDRTVENKITGFAGGTVEPELGKATATSLAHPVIHSAKSAPQTIKARHHAEKRLKLAFVVMNRQTVKMLTNALVEIKKAADPLDKELEAELEKSFEGIVGDLVSDYHDATQAGVATGAGQLGIVDEEELQPFIDKATDIAVERAAELVGLRWTGEKLVKDPSAKYSIAETTLDKIKEVTAELQLLENPTLTDVVKALDKTGVFSEARAELIAKNEMRVAQAAATLMVWHDSGAVSKVDWVVSSAHDQDDVCDALAADGPYDVNDVPDFPAHPNCLCSLVVKTLTGEEA